MGLWFGEWTYEGDSPTTPLGPGGKLTRRTTGRPLLNGFAAEFIYDEKGPAGETQSLEISWYDPAAKNHDYIYLSNDGYVEQGPYTINGNLTTWDSMKAEFKGKDISGQYRWTDTFIKRNGRWQCVATHASNVAQK